MTTLNFKATVDSFSRTKKGNITIQLTGTSYISLDKLSQISEGDESTLITLQSEQTKIGDYPLAPEEAVATVDEDEAEAVDKEALYES